MIKMVYFMLSIFYHKLKNNFPKPFRQNWNKIPDRSRGLEGLPALALSLSPSRMLFPPPGALVWVASCDAPSHPLGSAETRPPQRGLF